MLAERDKLERRESVRGLVDLSMIAKREGEPKTMSKSFTNESDGEAPPPTRGGAGGNVPPRARCGCPRTARSSRSPCQSRATRPAPHRTDPVAARRRRRRRSNDTSFSACVVCVVRFWRIRACGYRGDSAREEEPPPEGGVPADALVQQVAGEERVRLFPVPVAVVVRCSAHAHEERWAWAGGAFATVSSYLSAV